MEYFAYFDKLSIDSILLNDKENHQLRKLYRLYKLTGRYLNASIAQYNRLETWAVRQRELGTREASGLDFYKTDQVFPDIHFLLISMDKCYKYEIELFNILFGSFEADKLRTVKTYDDIRIMRNALEHSDENINKVSYNNTFNIPAEFEDNNWSWLEYQMSSLKNGKIIIKDRVLELSPMMFNDIITHYNKIIDAIQKLANQTRFDHLNRNAQ